MTEKVDTMKSIDYNFQCWQILNFHKTGRSVHKGQATCHTLWHRLYTHFLVLDLFRGFNDYLNREKLSNVFLRIVWWIVYSHFYLSNVFHWTRRCLLKCKQMWNGHSLRSSDSFSSFSAVSVLFVLLEITTKNLHCNDKCTKSHPVYFCCC